MAHIKKLPQSTRKSTHKFRDFSKSKINNKFFMACKQSKRSDGNYR